jgi:hypothetical protein
MTDSNSYQEKTTKAKQMIVNQLMRMDGEADITDLKHSFYKANDETSEDSHDDSPFKFVPTMGSGGPRSRSFNQAIRSCEGSEWIERSGSTIQLTEYGEETIQKHTLSSDLE